MSKYIELIKRLQASPEYEAQYQMRLRQVRRIERWEAIKAWLRRWFLW